MHEAKHEKQYGVFMYNGDVNGTATENLIVISFGNRKSTTRGYRSIARSQRVQSSQN